MDSIVLRDRNGKEINYHGIDYLNVKTPDGETQGYAAYDPETLTPENLVSGVKVGDVEGALKVPQAVETTVAPDFSVGDMEVSPEDGKVFSKVGVLKPANLTPGNIAKDVDIAGIIGTLAVGGNAKVAGGIVAANAVVTTGTVITHNLGVVPDLIIVIGQSTGDGLAIVVAQSLALRDITGINSMQGFRIATPHNNRFSWDVDFTTATYLVNSVNETTFVVGNSLWPLQGADINWIAISGLT